MADAPVDHHGEPGSPVASSADWGAAVDRIRATNDWIVRVFVGLGVVFVGTGPVVASIGDLEADLRGMVAIGSATVVIACAGAIAWLASDVSLTERTSIAELRNPGIGVDDPGKRRSLRRLADRVQDAPDDHLGGAASLDELMDRRDATAELVQDQADARFAVLERAYENNRAPDEYDLALVDLHLARTVAELEEDDRVVLALTEWACYEVVRGRFVRNRRRMAVLGLVAFVALSAWAGAVDPGPSGDTTEGAARTGSAPDLAGGL